MAFPNTRQLAPGFAGGKALQTDIEFYDDFTTSGYGTTTGHKFASTADVSEWLYTALGGGTPTFKIKDAGNGSILAADIGAATDNHGFECQLNGEVFSVRADKDIYFEVRWASRTTVTALDWVFGLGSTETTFMAGPTRNFMGFTSGSGAAAAVLDGAAANVIARTLAIAAGGAWTASAATQTSLDTGVDIVAATYNTMSMWLQLSGSTGRLHFYVDGSEKFVTTSTIPAISASSDPLTLMFGAQNNGSVQGILDIDYIYCAQTR